MRADSTATMVWSSTGMPARASRLPPLFQVKWVWASHRPDMRVMPLPSITFCPSRGSAPPSVAMSLIRPSAMPTSPATGPSALPSRMLTFVNRVFPMFPPLSALC